MVIRFNSWLLAGGIFALLLTISAVFFMSAKEPETKAADVATATKKPVALTTCFSNLTIMTPEGNVTLNNGQCSEAQQYIGACVVSASGGDERSCDQGTQFCCATVIEDPNLDCNPIILEPDGIPRKYKIATVSCWSN